MVSLFLLLGCNLSYIVVLFAALHELASASARTLLKARLRCLHRVLRARAPMMRALVTGLNNVCACASCQGASDCARPKYHNNPYENGGVFKNSRVEPGVLQKRSV